MILYGPYTRKDTRQHVIHYDPDTKRRITQSYPRYLMEQHLGRKLETWEEVDHINDDPSDNRIENFQILTCRENNQKSFLGTGEYGIFVCPTCLVEFSISMSRYRNNQLKQKKAGPYCSRSCAGKMHH